MKAKVKAKVKVKVRARARATEVMEAKVKAKVKARVMEVMEAKGAAKVRARAMEVMEAKGVAKEAVIVSLFRIDDDPCVLIWFYDLSQPATVGQVVKSTIVPTTLNKEVDTVVPKVCAFLNRLTVPGGS
jgi:hypothetical protein